MTSQRRRSTLTPSESSNPQFILSQMQSLGSDLAQNRPGAREQLLNLSHALISALELPSEAIQRFGSSEPARTAYLRAAVDLDLFTHLHSSGPSGITSESLASQCGTDPALLSRILKHLAATNVVLETDADTYAPTRLSEAFALPTYRDGLLYAYDVPGPSFRRLPAYLRETGYRPPSATQTPGPFQAAHGTDLPFPAWLDRHPDYLAARDSYAAATATATAHRASSSSGGKPSWADDGFYPIADRLIKGFDPGVSDVFLVDVGGGRSTGSRGDDLRELQAKLGPSLPGRLVLQDREEVVAAVSKETKGQFEVRAHDLFARRPQPAAGARGYLLHSVLHDLGDDDCARVLEGLKPAVVRGSSRVLVYEVVVPDQGAGWPVTAMDALALVLGGARERTARDWEAILARAGYRVAGVYTCEMGSESLIEAELA